jgi:hypothetical protein
VRYDIDYIYIYIDIYVVRQHRVNVILLYSLSQGRRGVFLPLIIPITNLRVLALCPARYPFVPLPRSTLN